MRGRKWKDDDLIKIIPQVGSIRQILIYLKLVEAGGNYLQIKNRIKELNLDTSHFHGKGWNKRLKFVPFKTKSLKEILVQDSCYQSYKLKVRLFKEKILTQECVLCGWAKVSEDGRIPVEIDHINGDHSDNRLVNLRILCPNCHSLQITHRGRNKKRK